MLGIVVRWLLGKVRPVPGAVCVDSVRPRWRGVGLALVCLLQVGTSLLIERRYERGLARQFYWVIWYPLAFWTIGMAAAVVALPRTLLSCRQQRRARWISPDRGGS